MSKIHLVMDKGLVEQDRLTMKLYGAYQDSETAMRVANHINMFKRHNPFLAGNLRGTQWEGDVSGFLRYVKPKVISLEVDQFDETTLRLDKYSIDTFWKEKA